MKKLIGFILTTIFLVSCGGSESAIDKKLKLPEGFEPSYTIVTNERQDYKHGGLLIMRQSYRIVIPDKKDIKENCRHLAIKTYKSGVYNVSIFVYNNQSEMNGAYTLAKYEFCPYGDWNKTSETYKAKLDDYKENLICR